ncbi:MAG: cytochrome c oxidase subunit 3 [Myxococcota bacterium]|jgi:heme/copper-type cytochrome/quinol oxidase subunit 3|nr:cytochrome c oxidase subunit 3 [Myxococcota bacterium]
MMTAPLQSRQKLIPNAVLGMTLFLFTETMIFCGLVGGYLVLRGQTMGLWPPADQPVLPVLFTAFNTVLLCLSGVTIWFSLTALRNDNTLRAKRLLVATLILGGSFLLLQGNEWVALLSHGLTVSSSIYGGFFYTIVGCHALHVLTALAALGWIFTRFLRGAYNANKMDGLLAMRMYWLFVVGVWPPLYILVYLW